MATVAANYEQRARLMSDPNFLGRTEIAALKIAVAVALEDVGTPDHDLRMTLATRTIWDVGSIARNMVTLLASHLTTVNYDDVANTVSVPMTDSEFQTFIDQRWTMLAKAFSLGGR